MTGEDGRQTCRGWSCVDWLVRTHVPALLDFVRIGDLAGELRRLPEIGDADALAGAVPVLDAVPAAIDRAWERAVAAAAPGDPACVALWEAARSIEREALTRRVCAAAQAGFAEDERLDTMLEPVREAAEGLALFARLYAGLDAGLHAARSVPRPAPYERPSRVSALAARAAAVEALHGHRNEAYAVTVRELSDSAAGLLAPVRELQVA